MMESILIIMRRGVVSFVKCGLPVLLIIYILYSSYQRFTHKVEPASHREIIDVIKKENFKLPYDIANKHKETLNMEKKDEIDVPKQDTIKVEEKKNNLEQKDKTDEIDVPKKDKTKMEEKKDELHEKDKTDKLVYSQQVTQNTIDYIATHLTVHYEILSNILPDSEREFSFLIQITNSGTEAIRSGGWAIYLNHMRKFDVDPSYQGMKVANRDVVTVEHINGYLYRLVPTAKFGTLKPGAAYHLVFISKDNGASRYYVFPNWYVTAEGKQPRILECTKGESLDFVRNFVRPEQWKRQKGDLFDPFTPEVRFALNTVQDKGPEYSQLIVPKPYKIQGLPGVSATVNGSWVIVSAGNLKHEVEYLKSNFPIKLGLKEELPKQNFISLVTGDPGLPKSKADGTLYSEDSLKQAYSVSIQSDKIIVTATSATGIFYGIQSLLSLAATAEVKESVQLKLMVIHDIPRFPYRGLHVDVGRNFFSKEHMIRLLDHMAMYKLNKLHLHLTEDSGWRLEIPGLEELTKIGGCRGHDLTETRCIIPQLGSGPDTSGLGSGYYTVTDYKEILKHAADLHIEVIPEIDMPGHSHAAVKAMEARYKAKKEKDQAEATQYLLTDWNDKSEYHSVQQYNQNVINPCMESSYRFVEHLLKQLVMMHENVNPLRTFHFGGDELPRDSTSKSPACVSFLKKNPNVKSVKEYFVTRLAHIAHKYKLNIQGWDDGYYWNSTVFPRNKYPNKEAYANPWVSVWEWGQAQHAHELANAGYKVIMSHATFLYFDHPYEPDPEERGLFWATRYIDTKRVFGFKPMHLYDNLNTDRLGNKINREEVCGKDEAKCTPLKQKQNIVGMQGQLWTELIRTPEQFDFMVYPRLLALAERAWHEAPWESLGNTAQQKLEADWSIFAHTLGYKELKRLDKLGIYYRLPVPGARLVNGQLQVNSAFPGLVVQYSEDRGKHWVDFNPNRVPRGCVWLATRSPDGKRRSRAIAVDTSAPKGLLSKC